MRHANERPLHPEFEVGDLVYLTMVGQQYVMPYQLKGQAQALSREGLCGVVIETRYRRPGTGGDYLVMVGGECHWFYPTDLEKI